MKELVRRYWEERPCGAELSRESPGSAKFFAEVERERYRLEPFIEHFADYEAWRGKDVLEVGVGVGSDFMRFVRHGARATGIDMTAASVSLVRRRLSQESRRAHLAIADAEELPFASARFDLVYAWGILHHTPDTVGAIAEIRRVLRTGGEVRAMVYHRRSWVAVAFWLRYGLLRGRPQTPVNVILGSHLESPGTRAYTTGEARALFGEFSDLRITVFPTPYDRRVAGNLAALFPRFGWFMGIAGRKPT